MQKEKLTDAQRELVEANLGLARMAAWKFRESCAKVGIDLEDAMSIAYMGLIKGARSYDPSISKPGTYLMRGCELALLMELRKHRVLRLNAAQTVSLETPICMDKDGGAIFTIAETIANPGPALDDACIASILMDDAMSHISPRQREILRLMQDGLSQHEIGRRIGCSQAYVSRLLAACRKQVREAIA